MISQSIRRRPIAFVKALVFLQLLIGLAGRGPSVSALAQTPPAGRLPGNVAQPAQATSHISAQNHLTTRPPVLRGFVDLHTHPMTNLAFGGKLLYGGVDVGSMLPADPNCNQTVLPNTIVRAASEQQALGHDASTHGGPNVNANPFAGPLGVNANACGNTLRELLIHKFQQSMNPPNDPSGDASGYPTFADWPKWNDLTHQKMWVEWIRRAYRGGLRVMVALATNNKTLGDVATAGNQSSFPDLPTDDKISADLQIDEIIAFVGRHSDFMEVAYSSSDVYRIVSAGKMAVIIGMEIDHIGDFQQVFYRQGLQTPIDQWGPAWAAAAIPPTDDAVRGEIDRLWNKGVRYIFPIHLLDNAFGGTAAYINLFNVSNSRESGHPWALVCTNSDGIQYRYDNNDTTLPLIFGPVNLGALGIVEPQCPPGYGQKNSLGLTSSGVVAIKEMMKKGMLIDIDHMSQASADQALQLACYGRITNTLPFIVPCPFGYPMNSGHNGLRGALPTNPNERALRVDQYAMIGQLHGMAGVGSAQLDAASWLQLYNQVIHNLGGDNTYSLPYGGYLPGAVGNSVARGIVAAFGTDMNGLEFGMPPRLGGVRQGPNYKQYQFCVQNCDCAPDTRGKPNAACMKACFSKCAKIPNAIITVSGSSVQYNSAFPRSTDGPPSAPKTWDYNTDGVAHYGMLPDFLQDVRSLPGGTAMIDNNFMFGADYLFHTWQIAESKSAQLQ